MSHSSKPAFESFPEQRNFLLDQPTSDPIAPAVIETTLGALREMRSISPQYCDLPPLIAEFLLDNGYQHDDTAVCVVPGDVWLKGSR